MIKPTTQDIGKRVVFTDPKRGLKESGVIVSLNDLYVFVRYDWQQFTSDGQATKREGLVWEAV